MRWVIFWWSTAALSGLLCFNGYRRAVLLKESYQYDSARWQMWIFGICAWVAGFLGIEALSLLEMATSVCK